MSTTQTCIMSDAPKSIAIDPPQSLEADFLANYEKLSREQAGHLRHFHNLASQRDGEWNLMGSQEPGQEWVDAYRYQLATMGYASAAAHYHRLPALRSAFRALLERLIHKMLRRDVWGYWFLTSHSGKFVDPDIEELRKPWADPIVKENIMYSGHLLLMVSLYAMLFNDDKYDREGALTFNWNPIFWGMGPEKFSYTRKSLQTTILAEMERENWLGVCCEPNSIFIVCNQFPIIAFRYNDIRDGTDVATEVIKKYSAAWKAKGMTQDDGMFLQWYSPKQDRKKETKDIGSTAWGAAFMNSWNPSVAHHTFDTQTVGFLSREHKGRVNVQSSQVAFAIRDLVKKGADPDSPSTIQAARRIVLSDSNPPFELPFPRPTFGYVLQWVSEVGDQATLDGLLAHVDEFFQPAWHKGGLYYPVNERRSDQDGNWTEVEPYTGNAAVGYSRLNVFDGQRKMWTDPWTPEHVSNSPFIDGVDLGSGIDFFRGFWDQAREAMVVTMRSWDGALKSIKLQCCNLPIGRYASYCNSELASTHHVIRPGDSIEISLDIAGDEFDLVLLRV